VFVIVLLLLAIPSYTKEKQDYDHLRWTINVEGTNYKVSEVNDWGWGLGLKIMYGLSGTFGIHAGAIGIPTTNGGYSFRGLALDGGIWFRLPSLKHWLTFEAGINHIFGDDSDGSLWLATGAHAGANATYWLGKHIGLFGRAVFRFWFKKEDSFRGRNATSPSFSAGLALRF
jgi:hypothetical protein